MPIAWPVIGRCRQDLLASERAALRNLATSPDFFSASACRDLLFHVHEHHLTLPEIKSFLTDHHLAFLGFTIDSHIIAHYRARFLDDVSAINLNHWHAYETENPGTFGAMYQFWVQRRL
jgi:hypothetical protein